MRFPTVVTSLLVTAATLGGCDKGPVEWRGDARQVAMPAPGDEGSAPADAHLVLGKDGAPMLQAVVPPPTPLPTGCRAIQASASAIVWSMQPDSLPMITFIRWRTAQAKGQRPDTSRAATFARLSDFETALVIAIPFAAAAMARGLWLLG